MYLSDRDLELAIDQGKLIIDPRTEAGPTSIDLHLDSTSEAQIWDIQALATDNRALGLPDRELNIARMQYGKISRKYLVSPPHHNNAPNDALVVRRDDCIVVRPSGFVLWQTKEIVGTPEQDPEFICFIDGKSTRARTGVAIHMTTPTIHAGWSGNVTLEITNCGPFDIVLHEGDAVAQVTVARITSPPRTDVKQYESQTHGQADVTGATQHSENA